MRKLIVISLLTIFVCGDTVFGEVFKLPALVEHYMEHARLEDHISIISFLKEHYTNSEHHPDIPHHHHDNLPFKALNGHTFQIVSAVPHTGFELWDTDGFNNKKRYRRPMVQYTYNALSQIWQPPRLG